jgi:chemotaxis protein CheD
VLAKKRNLIVDVSDAKISKSPNDVIATYSLGSCIGVCIYDTQVKIGGMLHYQLPDSRLDAQKAIDRPFMFADTGLRLLMQSMISAGCTKKAMRVKIAGGASMRNGPANFEIGKRNYLSIRKCLWKAGLLIEAENVGGSSPRNLYLDIASGTVTMRMDGITKEL